MQVHRERLAFQQRGADVAFVGNGASHFARAFAEDFKVDAPIYVDPARTTYRALGMVKTTVTGFFSPATLLAAARAAAGGHMQSSTKGSATQLGGVLVVRPGGEVVYRYLSKHAGDHPPVADVLAAV